jgi:hypothetical protein
MYLLIFSKSISLEEASFACIRPGEGDSQKEKCKRYQYQGNSLYFYRRMFSHRIKYLA